MQQYMTRTILNKERELDLLFPERLENKIILVLCPSNLTAAENMKFISEHLNN